MGLDTIIILVIILCIYMWPLAIIAASDRSRGNEKTYWMLATVFLSWIGLILYRYTTLDQEERLKRHRKKMQYQRKKAQALKRKQMQEQQNTAAEDVEEALASEEDDGTQKAPEHLDKSA